MKARSTLLSIVAFLALVGCGGSSDDTLKAPVLDSAVEGLSYKNAHFEEKTDAQGYFKYKKGDKTSFYLGGMKLGETTTPEDQKVFLTDIVGAPRGDFENPKVLKIARLVQGFDKVAGDDKITLDEELVKQLPKDTKLDALEVDTLNIAGLNLPTAEMAKAHMEEVYKKVMEEIKPTKPTNPENPTDKPSKSEDATDKPTNPTDMPSQATETDTPSKPEGTEAKKPVMKPENPTVMPSQMTESNTPSNPAVISPQVPVQPSETEVPVQPSSTNPQSESQNVNTSPQQGTFTLSSSAFSDGGILPNAYRKNMQGQSGTQQCSGENKLPPLSWSNAPKGTKSFVITMIDKNIIKQDGKPMDFPHWILGVNDESLSSIDDGAANLLKDPNAFGGACPPNAPESVMAKSHPYEITIYALNEDLTDEKFNALITEQGYKAPKSSLILGTAKITTYASFDDDFTLTASVID